MRISNFFSVTASMEMRDSMRVIAGSARSLTLKTPEGMETRPTTDRIRETLFNILMPYLCDCSFLDLFSGSGAIGIEALSRGASECIFVENNRKAAACILENLSHTRLADRGRLLTADVFAALPSLAFHGPFDLIFMDPPYGKDLERQVLLALAGSPLLDARTLIIAEARLETDFSYAGALGFAVEREKKYKTNKHVFLRKSDS